MVWATIAIPLSIVDFYVKRSKKSLRDFYKWHGMSLFSLRGFLQVTWYNNIALVWSNFKNGQKVMKLVRSRQNQNTSLLFSWWPWWVMMIIIDGRQWRRTCVVSILLSSKVFFSCLSITSYFLKVVLCSGNIFVIDGWSPWWRPLDSIIGASFVSDNHECGRVQYKQALERQRQWQQLKLQQRYIIRWRSERSVWRTGNSITAEMPVTLMLCWHTNAFFPRPWPTLGSASRGGAIHFLGGPR